MKRKPDIKLDGWQNVFTGQGIANRDKQTANTFAAPIKIPERTLDDAYRGDGFTRRVVDLPAKQMVNHWFDVTNDTDGLINKYLLELNAKKTILRSVQWSRVFGGSLLVMGLNDGGTFEDELNESRLKDIDFFRTYSRHRVTWTSSDLYGDPEHKKFGRPEWYTVTPINAGAGSPSFRVHETRTIAFDGMDVSEFARVENDGWGDSYVQHVWNQLANLSGAFFAGKNVIDDFIQIIMKIEGLQSLIENGQEELIKTRLDILDLGRSSMNTMMLDSKEDFEKHANSVSGLADLLDRFGQAVSGVTGIPFSLLMGRSPGGLNSSGDADIRFWYDSVEQEQESVLLQPLNRIVYLAQISSDGPTDGKEIKDWSISFNPLWTPTEKETAETRKTVAEADVLYINSGVLDPAEVAASRFSGSEYSSETTIDLEGRKPPKKENEKSEVES